MRNNMTASMFDLSMKDKTKSPFAKLKDKMKGRKNDGTFSDTSSAIIPSTHIPDANLEVCSGEVQMKSKPKKTFPLGTSAAVLSPLHVRSNRTTRLLRENEIQRCWLLPSFQASAGVLWFS